MRANGSRGRHIARWGDTGLGVTRPPALLAWLRWWLQWATAVWWVLLGLLPAWLCRAVPKSRRRGANPSLGCCGAGLGPVLVPLQPGYRCPNPHRRREMWCCDLATPGLPAAALVLL